MVYSFSVFLSHQSLVFYARSHTLTNLIACLLKYTHTHTSSEYTHKHTIFYVLSHSPTYRTEIVYMAPRYASWVFSNSWDITGQCIHCSWLRALYVKSFTQRTYTHTSQCFAGSLLRLPTYTLKLSKSRHRNTIDHPKKLERSVKEKK